MTIGLALNPVNAHITVNQMVDGFFTKSVAGAVDVALTDDESTWAIIELTGAVTADIDVTIPDIANTITVINNTTGGNILTFKSLTGNGVIVSPNSTVALYCDGTNVLPIVPLELSNTISSSGNVLTLDLSTGRDFETILTENVTSFVFSNAPEVCEFTLDITQDGTGARDMATALATLVWPGGTVPTLTTTAGSNAVLKLRTKDGGTTVQGIDSIDDFS